MPQFAIIVHHVNELFLSLKYDVQYNIKSKINIFFFDRYQVVDRYYILLHLKIYVEKNNM